MTHQAVLLKQSIQGLDIRPNGVYLDVTFGTGGHAQAILEQLGEDGKLYAFDQDIAAEAYVEEIKNKNFQFIYGNFRFLSQLANFYHIPALDGIIADLGMSSIQLDAQDRGFSFRWNGPLDMRMNTQLDFTAKDLINTYTLQQLTQIFQNYGELKQAYLLSQAIIQARQLKTIATVEDLLYAIQKFIPKLKTHKYCAKVFQALRIAVNDELQALEMMLIQSVQVLKPNGRLVTLAYHGLEDRLIKRFMKTGNFEGNLQKDIYGNIIRPFEPLYNKAIQPSAQEIIANNRSRSAKLRIAQRILPKPSA